MHLALMLPPSVPPCFQRPVRVSTVIEARRIQLEVAPAAPLSRQDELNQELLRACFFGYLDRIIELLAAGADPTGQSRQGNRPLHILVCARRPELMGPLLRAGADPRLAGAALLSALELARNTGQDLALRYMNSSMAPAQPLSAAA